ncbi:MAG: 2Fe-2S iron-sulfur cluster-binding protein [Treponemataceae bacterium]|nr:MAG: 2Fe-2S iron-sulfur cluster-binding protein [Treponemataceae bacterium]
MKIPLRLNGVQIVLNVEADEKLFGVLREKNCFDIKCGCGAGVCGSCMVLMDDIPVPACIIPAAAARNSHVITLNYFMTLPDYEDIKKGFEHAGIELCGYCDAGKILGAYHLITRYKNLTRKQIHFVMSSLTCRCADDSLIANGIVFASALREKRIKKERHV